MPAQQSHPNLEFHVEIANNGIPTPTIVQRLDLTSPSPLLQQQEAQTMAFKDWEEASRAAFVLAAKTHGPVNLDVVVFDEEAARAYGGDEAVKQYHEDPEASVFERFEIRVNNIGRVP